MKWFKKKEDRALIGDDAMNSLLALIKALGLTEEETVTRAIALDIPTVSACVDLISDTIATLPIKLYKSENNNVTEINDDIRLTLLNDETGDTLDSFQMKKSLISDYLLVGNGYAYINKQRNKITGLHYVEELNVGINKNIDPIFKNYTITVNGDTYKPHNFLKLLRNTVDGATGLGIIQTNPKVLSVAYNSLVYENVLAKTGGNKKGFIKAQDRLTADSIAILKQQWNSLYSMNNDNCVVLNNGLDFKESSSTSTEMQMNENKNSNAIEICKIFKVPSEIFTGQLNNELYEQFVKMAILPVLQAFISCINKDLLTQEEKKNHYFAFDIKELLKGDIEKRYKAYEIGIKNGFLTVNDVRYDEDREPIEAFNDTVKLGLQDVLFNTKTGDIYTPNTDKTSNLKGGVNSESGS